MFKSLGTSARRIFFLCLLVDFYYITDYMNLVNNSIPGPHVGVINSYVKLFKLLLHLAVWIQALISASRCILNVRK